MTNLKKSFKALLFYLATTALAAVGFVFLVLRFDEEQDWFLMFALALLLDAYFWSLLYLGPKQFDIDVTNVSPDIRRVIKNTLIIFTILMGLFALTNGFGGL